MIGILFINNLDVCPYLEKYLDVLEKKEIPYEIIYWDRRGDTIPERNHHVLNMYSSESKHPLRKILDFLRFRTFALKILRKRKYEKLIVLTSLTGVMLTGYLRRHYKGKYIFDYRDASYEWLSLYYSHLSSLISNSYFTCISSEGFKNILPKAPYVLAHNIKYNDLDKRVKSSTKSKLPIKVCFIGLVSEKDYLDRQIKLFSKDPRFELTFHGGGEALDYIKEQAGGEYQVTGRYTQESKYDLFESADMILCNRLSSYINDWAMANKLYEAVMFKKPLIGNSKTYSGQVITKNRIGISLSYEDKDYLDKIFTYYQNLDMDFYIDDADDFLDRVLAEDLEYLKNIRKFICEE